MELYGIILSVPGSFIAIAIFCLLLSRALTRWPRLSGPLVTAAIVVVIGLAVEFNLLAAFGAVGSRELIGPAFYVVHSGLYLLGVPSLATLLTIAGWQRWFGRWYVVASLCCVFASGHVLLEFSVFESLYGVDGIDGPYGGW